MLPWWDWVHFIETEAQHPLSQNIHLCIIEKCSISGMFHFLRNESRSFEWTRRVEMILSSVFTAFSCQLCFYLSFIHTAASVAFLKSHQRHLACLFLAVLRIQGLALAQHPCNVGFKRMNCLKMVCHQTHLAQADTDDEWLQKALSIRRPVQYRDSNLELSPLRRDLRAALFPSDRNFNYENGLLGN